MRRIPRVLAIGLAILSMAPSAARDDPPESAVVQMQVTSAAGEVHGTGVLIQRDDGSSGTTLYFLTSARLLDGKAGEAPAASGAIRVALDQTHTVTVNRQDVTIEGEGAADVAVVRARVAEAPPLAPRPIAYAPPPVGSVFVIAGFDAAGEPRTVAEHVASESSLVVVGDRPAALLAGCVGAPAIAPGGVFGIVRECDGERPPIVSLLSTARPALDRYMPRPTTGALPAPQFEVVDRQVTEPFLFDACSAPVLTHVDVPLLLASREALTEATASIAAPREVRVGDVSVLRLDDRALRVQFTLGGYPGPPVPPAPCPQGQALITLRLRVAVSSMP